MKITVVALFASVFSIYATEASSQNAKVSIHANQLSTKELIAEIEKQTDYLFVYNRNEVDVTRLVSLNVRNESVSDVLNKIFAETNISYQLVGKNISLMIRNAAPQEVSQQKKKIIQGVVVDQTGLPIIGANVVEKGTTNGSITDIDGKFSLSISDNAILQVSYIGYNMQELAVAGKDILNIKLIEDTQALDEVVVVGFGTQKKVNLTGAVSTVKMEEVMGDRPVVSVEQALQGTMPGLQITTTSGKPGQSMDMNIRGINRINLDEYGEGKPLVLVDNVPMDINMISPSDIETVTVLKDAASAAIYGARAAFGVILITTKQSGKDQQMRINYNNNFAFTTPQGLIQKASPIETVRFYKDMGYKSGRYAMGGQDIDSWLSG